MNNYVYFLSIIFMVFLCSACQRKQENLQESKEIENNIIVSFIDGETCEVVQKVVFSSDKTTHDINFMAGNGRWDIGYNKIILWSDKNGVKTVWKYKKSESRFYGYSKYYFNGEINEFKKLLRKDKIKENNIVLKHIDQED